MEISARKMNRQLWDMWRAADALDGKVAPGSIGRTADTRAGGYPGDDDG